MSPRLNLTGLRFGRLVVIAFSHVTNGLTYWRCRCDDGGKETTVRGTALQEGNTLSCGCLNTERIKQAKTTHGHALAGNQSPEYRCWQEMIRRCEDPTRKNFKYYGGRGINCRQWRKSFETFLAYLMATIGPKPKGKTLDRINNDGNYEPGNVRWATPKEQANNRRPRRKKS